MSIEGNGGRCDTALLFMLCVLQTYKAADRVASMIKQLTERPGATGSARLLPIQSIENQVEPHEERGCEEHPRRRESVEIGGMILEQEVAGHTAAQGPDRQQIGTGEHRAKDEPEAQCRENAMRFDRVQTLRFECHSNLARCCCLCTARRVLSQ